MTEVFILVPALLGLKGNLEMTLASRLSTAVSVPAGRTGVCRTPGSTEPGWEIAPGLLNGPRLECGAGVGRCREIPGWVSCSWQGLPARVVPRLGFWMSQPSLDSCPTPCFATRLVTVCAALTGKHHAGPSTCTDGGRL